jgi:hypothetical protein
MPGRGDCFLTGCARIHHRSEHRDLRLPRGLQPCGQAPDDAADDGRCRCASSMPTLSATSPASTNSDTVPTQ